MEGWMDGHLDYLRVCYGGHSVSVLSFLVQSWAYASDGVVGSPAFLLTLSLESGISCAGQRTIIPLSRLLSPVHSICG